MNLDKYLLLDIFSLMCISEPLIEFEGSRYTVKEPVLPGDVSVVRIPVVRRGDLSKLSVVRVHTRDGLAESGVDYNGFSTGKNTRR